MIAFIIYIYTYYISIKIYNMQILSGTLVPWGRFRVAEENARVRGGVTHKFKGFAPSEDRVKKKKWRFSMHPVYNALVAVYVFDSFPYQNTFYEQIHILVVERRK